MDTSCPLDLMDQGDAAPCAEHIRHADGITVATASGELRADRALDLHIEDLDEDLALLVLPNTPNVLARQEGH